jgi:tetratricopeptide (TPR) repeat protein
MSNQDDLWLWFIDDAPLQALLKAEGDLGAVKLRAASSPGIVRAMALHMEGRVAEAASALRAAIDSGDRKPEAYLLLGQLRFEARQFEDALAVYRELLALDVDNGVAIFNAAVCLEKLARWDEAAELFRRAVDLKPERPEAALGLGLCCLHLRRPAEALDAFDRTLAALPDSEPCLFGRAVALQMLRRYDDAAAIYDRFRTGGEPSAELLTNLLALAVARRDREELERVCEQLNQLRPGSRQALEARAFAAALGEDWDAALELLEQFPDTASLPDDWAYARAFAFWRAGRGDDAAAAVDDLLGQRPDHAPALLLRGALRERNGETALALDDFADAASRLPGSFAAAWNLARLAALAGEPDRCGDAARTVAELDPGSAEAAFARGLAALLGRRPAEAIDAFTEAARLRPEWADARWNLGLSLLGAGEPARAAKTLESAGVALGGAVPVLPLVLAAMENRQPERALQLLESAGALDGGGSATVPLELLYNLAFDFQQSARLDEAARLYRTVIALGPEFADAHINLGHLLLSAGKPEEAEALWTAAAELERSPA